MEYLFHLYSPLRLDLSMFSHFWFNFESKLANIALGVFNSVSSDHNKFMGLLLTLEITMLFQLLLSFK